MKQCSGCRVEQPLEMFSKNKRTKDGYGCYCKGCVAEKNREQYEKNRERRKAEAREYRANNKEAVNLRDRERCSTDYYRDRRRAHYAENRDRINERQRSYVERTDYHRQWRKRNHRSRIEWERAYREENRERLRESARASRMTNPERFRIAKHNYRSRKLMNGLVPMTPEQIDDKIRYWGSRCWICSKELAPRDIQLDHVKPINKGGMTCLSNLRPACKSCNSAKRDRWPFHPEEELCS